MRLLFGLALALASCTHSSSVTCDGGRICPADTVCVSLTVQAVSPDQCAPSGSIDACANLADFAPCTNAGVAGVCYPTTGGHACLPSGCGNGILDANEVCDDANAVAGDGCSDSCKSNETCGNDVVDPVTGEVCDDGNHQSHDGCAQACGQTEAPSWIQHTIEIPGPRTGVAMAYDASTQQIVMFGGSTGATSYADTWIMTNGWGASTELGPAARELGAVAYDSARHRIVLFGGELQNGLSLPASPYSFYADTWEWDGAHWRQAASADQPHPSARSNHSMAYDPVRKRIVLFGGGTRGEGLATYLNDTWEWDGTTWTQITSADATAPSGRKDAALGYDPTAGKMVLFGGQAGAPNAETWTYDGTSWTKLAPANSPQARSASALTIDPTSHHLLMWGGLDAASANVTELWRWDGSTWTKLSGTGPTATSGMGFATNVATNQVVVFGGIDLSATETAATWQWNGSAWTAFPFQIPTLREQGAAYDQQRGRAVIFGGALTTNDLNDVWELGDQQWTKLNPTTKPAARRDMAIAYDADRHVTVIFGGCTTVNCTPTGLGNTYLWNGTTWVPDMGPQPSDRGAPAMVYDAARKQLVMFGGVDPAHDELDETWVWNGAWTQLHPPDPQPPARWHHSMAYDPIRGKVVMFGGGDFFNNFFDDTWEWDGTSWTQRVTPIAPLPRGWAAMAWSPDLGKIVLFGGANTASVNQATADTWVLDGSGWTELSIPVVPPQRLGASLFPTRTGSGLTLFGGTEADLNNIGLEDTWDLVWSNPAVVDDTCHDLSDSDGDGAIGCADSDCWATCTPGCLPGTTCDPAQPSCGDGVCNADLETCRNCPSDCTCATVCGDFVCDPGETCPGDCGQ